MPVSSDSVTQNMLNSVNNQRQKKQQKEEKAENKEFFLDKLIRNKAFAIIFTLLVVAALYLNDYFKIIEY